MKMAATASETDEFVESVSSDDKFLILINNMYIIFVGAITN